MPSQFNPYGPFYLGEAMPAAVPRKIAPAEIVSLRRRLHMSQDFFARTFGLNVETLRGWEQGRREPDSAARILLRVIDREPAAVFRALRRA
ncbi:MAG: transcriptional regulator [Alphaproteobacteria bacterium]|nr:transcriptional regulator [Alphaproteobacteria bacterium]